MKFFGDANLQQNQLQEAVIPLDTNFPMSPKVGRLAFVNSILYICISISNELPVWVPLTRELTLYTHSQTNAEANWVIPHNLNTTSVQVQIFDDTDRIIMADEVMINNANTVTAMFNTPITGKATVLTGHNDGSPKPTYSFIFYQQAPVTQWIVQHNLGREPITRIFVGNQEVQPLSITHNSSNQLTVNFNQPYAGIAKLV